MKTAMKLTTGILAIAMMAGGAWAQKTDAIDQARSVAKSLQQKQTTDTTAAVKTAAVPNTKPAPGAPAPAVKPAVIPAAKPAATAPVTAKSASLAASSTTLSSAENKLQRVNVVPNGDSIQIEISSSQSVTPRVSKLSSPARVVVELPETVVASSQNKIPVGDGGVKGVRIGMDGKTPPTTSVVVDLEKAMPYDIAPSASGKLVLTLHTQGLAPATAKAAPATPAKESKAAAQPQVAAKASPAPKLAAPKPEAAKTVVKAEASKPAVPVAKASTKQDAKTLVAAKALPAAPAVAPVAPAAKAAPKPEEKKWAMNGKRDPFFSPVVQQQGSGCSTGKKCLDIGAINLRGVVKSDTGFIAVVTNNLNKAYFLRENDPVFNGYVVKITGDSVTFQETLQDKLGKPFTREVVKKIFTPAV
jgi:Tfp pilus assembly protein PilP